MTENLQRRTLSDQVADRIKGFIIDNKLKPGDRLPTEHALADRFGVSRISVREATKALGFLGILDAAPRRGLRVGEVNMQRVTQYLGFHFAINDFPADQLINTRIILETGSLPYAMETIEEGRVADRLTELNDRLRGTTQLDEFIALDLAFHQQLIEASGLAPLVAFHDLLQVFFQRFRESIREAEWGPGIESHQRIIDALKGQRLDEACQELRVHIESHRGRICE